MMDPRGIRVALFIILQRFTIMEKQKALMRGKLGECYSCGFQCCCWWWCFTTTHSKKYILYPGTIHTYVCLCIIN